MPRNDELIAVTSFPALVARLRLIDRQLRKLTALPDWNEQRRALNASRPRP